MSNLYANRDNIVKTYERALAQRFEAKHAFALASKEEAFNTTLAAAGVLPNSEVILPILADYEVAKAVISFGATPVLCDVYPGTFIGQSEDMERRITGNTAALVTTSQWGRVGDFPFHAQLAQEKNVPLINFATTGLGSRSSTWKGKCATLECFGTDQGPVFNIGAGGVILTNDDAMAEKIASMDIKIADNDLCAGGLMFLQNYEAQQTVQKDAATRQWNGLYPVMMHMSVSNYPEYILRSNFYNLYFLYKCPESGLSEVPAYDANNPAFKRADDVSRFIEETGIVQDYQACKPRLLTDYAEMAEIHAARSNKPVKEEFEHACNTLRDIVVLPISPELEENDWAQLGELLYYEIVPGTYAPAPNFTAMLISNRADGVIKAPPPWDFVPDWFADKYVP